MQTGKKKLVLDHLIVQNMDDNDSDKDVQSILMFGAQTLFEQGDAQTSRDIHCKLYPTFMSSILIVPLDSEGDIQQLIERTEKEGDKQEPTAGEGGTFSFAKVWSAEQDVEDTPDERAQEDAWAQTLARIAEERSKERAKEETGRGVRRKAAAVFPQVCVRVISRRKCSFFPISKPLSPLTALQKISPRKAMENRRPPNPTMMPLSTCLKSKSLMGRVRYLLQLPMTLISN